ncbi:Transcriptional regulator CBF1 [Trametes pubescens]|uniref:Transcriptional regulator CBF1 n=1 Tax=Trametes pubescens TaxID=154538 RepID=A0A1M2VUU0_TRAPU|nr:Transcriptional regulator CBF1 [Trametes pubescens]
MASTQPAHDPALAHTQPAPSNVQQPAAAQPAQGSTQPNIPGNLIPGMANEHVMALLKHIPEMFNRGDLKDSAAAEALSNLSQTAFLQQHLPQPSQFPGMHPLQHNGMPSEPGPSSHPRGPPNLGQLSAVATALQATAPQPPPSTEGAPPSASQDGGQPQDSPEPEDGDSPDTERPTSTGKSGGRRNGRSSTMTNDEWARVRKDNHVRPPFHPNLNTIDLVAQTRLQKEVERRRRGNINEGINELGRIVPNGSGEKAKGAILSRAVQYIHHLKENEARNIEKWTLEKLLMDQAMGDLQAQLEEMRRMWEEERVARQRAEAELELLRGHAPSGASSAAAAPSAPASGASAPAAGASAAGMKENGKREREEGEPASGSAGETAEGDDRSKRPRVE